MNIKKTNNNYYGIFTAILIVFLIISIVLAVLIGSVDIKSNWVVEIVFNHLLHREYFEILWPKSIESIVWNIRLPRVLLAAFVGAGLSLSGIVMQALTKNSLSDPYILGISSGASAGAVATIMFGFLGLLGPINILVGAFIGAIVSIVITFKFASVNGRLTSTQLVLSGIAVSALFSAITNLLIFKESSADKVRTALFWMIGSLGSANWDYIMYIAIVFIICTSILLIFHKALDALLLGDDTAITLGVNIRLLKVIMIILCTLLTGAIVSVSGIIGFVGLVIPHITRKFVGSNHRKVMPAAILLGGLFLIWCDVFSRIIVSPEELPIGVVTAFVGAPFFLFILRKNLSSSGRGR